MIKQLVQDTLSSVIERDAGAHSTFKTFVEKRLRKGDEMNHGLMAELLCDLNPKDRLVEMLVESLCSKSLQSGEAIFRAGSFFDIPSRNICDEPEELKTVFKARNEIVHEMDVDFLQPNRNRRPRGKAVMINYTEHLFGVANSFLKAVVKKLKGPLST